MRLLFFISIFFLTTTNLFSQHVDSETPEAAKPENNAITGEWELDFSDEFNGTEVNTAKWNVDNSTRSRAARPNIGIYDWRWKPENVSVENGNLILKVYKTGTNAMTNGSVQSHTKYSSQYGYYEARIKVGDAAKGTHTAFWLQGPNMGNVDGTANDGAEIDIFETAWTGEYTKSVVHIDGYGADHQANTKKYDTPGIHSGFHTWGFHWTENFMDIYYDGVFKVRYSDQKWVVHSPEFLWLSNGASFGLTGDQYFLDYPIGYLTQTEVDYIRVWKDVSAVDENALSKENWALISTNTENADYPATNAFDGKTYTFWHSEWKDNVISHPHEIQIDLGGTANCTAFTYLPRQDGNPNGNVADYQLYASNDKNNWGEAVVSGTFTNDGNKKTIEFAETITCKYVKFVALSEVNGSNLSNAAEIGLLGEYTNEEGNGIYDNLKMVDINVYPNPFKDKLLVEWDPTNDFSFCHIYSMDGCLITKKRIESGSNQLKLDGFVRHKGNYIMKMIGKDIQAVKLLVKL